ncbi:PrpF protein-domain-containing protein [Pisolithus marmoratus]|nr:PrpF protein-domain-containing protein [Pisolithus marmoratus]
MLKWLLPTAHLKGRIGYIPVRCIPATFLRGGTSKGIFLNRDHLPADRSKWAPIFLRIMGSPDTANGLQINGMGGGISSLSKICVVGSPSTEQKAQAIDAEYTFAQVGIHDATVDYAGNCGNLSSMVGPFALAESICTKQEPSDQTTIHLFNTNTNSRIHTTFPITVLNGQTLPKLDLPQTSVAGVPGQASRILLEFPSPSGARTGKLLPTGNVVDIIHIRAFPGTQIPASLVDATNPSVFISHDDISRILDTPSQSSLDYGNHQIREIIESIRTEAAIKMGLDPTSQAQPKIAIAVPMTLGLCLGVAANIEGSVAWKNARPSSRREPSVGVAITKMKHPSGIVEVHTTFRQGGILQSVGTVRTGRWLMKGVVYH